MAKTQTLTVWLVGKTEPLQKALGQAKKSIGNFKNFVVSGMGALGVGLGFASLIASAKNLVDTLDGIGKSSSNLGISAESFQKLAYAARRTNTPVEMVEMAMRKTRLMAGNLAAGNVDAANTFNALGLRIEDLRGLKTDEMFNRIATALNYVDDPLERSALLAKMFGEEGEKLNNFLRDYNELGKEAESRGLIIREEEVKSAEALKDAIENLSSSISRLAANTGFVSWLNRVAEKLEGIGMSSEELKRRGYVNREDAVNFAIQTAQESGKYTDSQIEDMRSIASSYARKNGAAAFRQSRYVLLDQAMREAGFAIMARTNDSVWRRDLQFSGAADLAPWTPTPEEQADQRRKAAEEENRAQEERERLKRNREAAAEAAAAKAAEEAREKMNKRIQDMVSSAERENKIKELERSGNHVEAELMRRLGPLYGNENLDKNEVDRLRNLIEADLKSKNSEAEAQAEEQLLGQFSSLLNKFSIDDEQKTEAPEPVDRRDSIAAALFGSLEAYQARMNQSKNIPEQQLKIQEQQLAAQQETNRLLKGGDSAAGIALETAMIGG